MTLPLLTKLTLRRGAMIGPSQDDLDLAAWAGQERYRLNRERGYRDGHCYINDRPFLPDCASVGAEILFHHLVGVPVVPEQLVVADWHNTVDCVLPDGRTVDVKSTMKLRGRLLSRVDASHAAQLYVLMIEQWPHYCQFIGWAPAQELCCPENIRRDLGKWPCYALHQGRLHPDLTIHAPAD